MKISLILPCYNEETNLQRGVLDKIGNFISEDDRFEEVIIVDDGSTDGSRGIIQKKYIPQNKKFKLIENAHRGKAYAVMTGIDKASGDYVLFSDIDLATPIEESKKLIQEIAHGYTIIIGSRKSQRKGAPFLRKIMARGAVFVRGTLINLNGLKDTQCGFKLFEKKAAKDIISRMRVYHTSRKIRGSSVSAGFDMEFLFIATKLGYKIKEIPVTWKHVETRNVNFIKDSIGGLKDISLIKFNDLLGKYELS